MKILTRKFWYRAILFNRDKMLIKSFFYIFTLRQGSIVIALYQVIISFFSISLLFLAIAHVREMLYMLETDMLDEAEQRGFIQVFYGDQLKFQESPSFSTNNEKRFAHGKHLAKATEFILYTSTILMVLYVMSCLSLLYGAIIPKKEYMYPWIAFATLGLVLIPIMMVYADGSKFVLMMFRSHTTYRVICVIIYLIFVYFLIGVVSYIVQLITEAPNGKKSCKMSKTMPGQDNDQVVLLDIDQPNTVLIRLENIQKHKNSNFV